MKKNEFKKYLIDRATELIKFLAFFTILYLLITHAPDQTDKLISIAGAFILGGSQLMKNKKGLDFYS